MISTDGELLTRAYDEVQRLRVELDDQQTQHAEIERLRAELAEARTDHATAYANTVALAQECARLRAELANANDAADKWRDLFVSNEKAITRVRELVHGRWVSVDDLQSALDGGQQ